VSGNGVLIVFAGGCGCNYPITPSTFAVVHDPDAENWATYTGWENERSTRIVEDQPVRRLGINFGAPGERHDEEGTLWVHWPKRQTFMPAYPIAVKGMSQWRYHHATRIKSGTNKPWVAASSVVGATNITVGLTPERVVALRTDNPPTIDGTLSETCWGTDSVWMGPDFSGQVMLRYDQTNLYVGGYRTAPTTVDWGQFPPGHAGGCS